MGKYKIIPSSRTIVQSPISIGHKAEKGVEAIEFDLTAWVETYGSGTLTVIMRRWGDAMPYPIALEIDENNKATWVLSDTDTARAGMAYAQLNYIVGDEVVKKSDIYTFRVMDSLTGEGDPPEAYESWLEHLTHLAAEAMAEVLDIEGVTTDKTLTVDGGIADGKATGDALALKADKSTTYTKTQVDTLIESVDVETDTTLSVSGKPADAAETGRQFGLLKADLDDITNAKSVVFTKNGYIKTNVAVGAVVDLTPTAYNGIEYAVVDCEAGDAFFVSGTGSGAGRLWAFIDEDNKLLSVAAGSDTVEDFVLIAPINAVKCIFNLTMASNGTVLYGLPTNVRLNAINDTFGAITGASAITLSRGGYINTNVSVGSTIDLTPVANNQMAYAVFGCGQGDVILINGVGTTAGKLWAFIDGDDKLLSAAAASITGDNLFVPVPEDAAKCIINTTVAAMGVCVYGKLTQPQINEIRNAVSSKVDLNGTGQITPKNMQIVDVEMSQNLFDMTSITDCEYIKKDGSVISTSSYFVTDFIPVDAGESYYGTYKQTNSGTGTVAIIDMTARFITCYDSDKNILSAKGSDSNTTLNSYTVPSGVAYVRLSLYKSANYSDYQFEKGTHPTDYTAYGTAKSAKVNKKYLPRIESDFICARRPLICFTLDGNYPRTQAIIDIAAAHGYKIGLAPKWNSSFQYADGREQCAYLPSQYLEWQDEGHEILSHMGYNMPESTSYTDEECIEFIKQSYVSMIARGFDIKGAIGSSGIVAERFIPYVKRYYSYASTLANHAEANSIGYRNADLIFTTSEPYKLWRYSMQSSTLVKQKQAVDDAITNNGLVIFYGHAQSAEGISPRIFEDADTYGDDPDTAGSTTNLSGTDHFTEDNFDALLTYIDSKVANYEIAVVLPYEAVNDFYRLRKTDFTWS